MTSNWENTQVYKNMQQYAKDSKKAVELVCADFIAVGTAGNKPEAVEIVRLTTGQHPDGSRWTVVNARTKQGWRTNTQKQNIMKGESYQM